MFTGKDEIHSVPYHLIAADLRKVDELDKKLLAAGINQEWVYCDDRLIIRARNECDV